LARELHDQVGQSLTALSINLNILRNRMPTDALEQLKERLDDSVELVEETTKTIRNVMSELRPSVLDDYGLTAALRWYGKRFSDRTGISIKLNMDEMSFRLAETVESALFRITQEALTNVAKHANASELVLTFEESDGQFRLIIADNGKGFDYAAFSKAEVRTGWGILNMQERIQALGGKLQIDSEPGKGTNVSIEIRK
jgi:signal transduction histidine kinase